MDWIDFYFGGSCIYESKNKLKQYFLFVVCFKIVKISKFERLYNEKVYYL